MAVSNKVVVEGFEGAEVSLSSEGNTVKLDSEATNPVTATLSSEGNTVQLDLPDGSLPVSVFNPVFVAGSVEAKAPELEILGYASETNAIATATVAAEPGSQHKVQVFLAGYSDLTVSGTVTLGFGATPKFVWPFVGSVQVVLPGPLVADDNEAVSVALSSGGEGKVGHVAFFGRTEPTPEPEPES